MFICVVGPESLVEGEDYLHSDYERDGSFEEFLFRPPLPKGTTNILDLTTEYTSIANPDPCQACNTNPVIDLYGKFTYESSYILCTGALLYALSRFSLISNKFWPFKAIPEYFCRFNVQYMSQPGG